MPAAEFRDKPEGVFFPFDVLTTNVSVPCAVSGALLLGGWSFIESTGAAVAQVDLIDGGPNGGVLLATMQLPIGASLTKSAPGRGLSVQSGLFIRIGAGSVRGSLWLADQ